MADRLSSDTHVAWAFGRDLAAANDDAQAAFLCGFFGEIEGICAANHGSAGNQLFSAASKLTGQVTQHYGVSYAKITEMVEELLGSLKYRMEQERIERERQRS